MAMLKFEVPHALPKDEARKRVEALLAYWSKKYGVQSSWQGDGATLSGKAMGVSIDARLQVTDAKVGGESKDPGMLLRGQAQKYLTRKFAEFLDSKKSLADLQRDDD